MHIIVYANTNTKVRSPGESYGLWCNTGFHRNIIKFSATCALQIGTFDLPVIQPPIALVKPLTGWVWLAVMRSEKQMIYLQQMKVLRMGEMGRRPDAERERDAEM